MTRSAYWGARGGELWKAPSLVERLEKGELIRATCSCPFPAQYIEPNKIGRKCGLCHGRLVDLAAQRAASTKCECSRRGLRDARKMLRQSA